MKKFLAILAAAVLASAATVTGSDESPAAMEFDAPTPADDEERTARLERAADELDVLASDLEDFVESGELTEEERDEKLTAALAATFEKLDGVDAATAQAAALAAAFERLDGADPAAAQGHSPFRALAANMWGAPPANVTAPQPPMPKPPTWYPGWGGWGGHQQAAYAKAPKTTKSGKAAPWESSGGGGSWYPPQQPPAGGGGWGGGAMPLSWKQELEMAKKAFASALQLLESAEKKMEQAMTQCTVKQNHGWGGPPTPPSGGMHGGWVMTSDGWVGKPTNGTVPNATKPTPPTWMGTPTPPTWMGTAPRPPTWMGPAPHPPTWMGTAPRPPTWMGTTPQPPKPWPESGKKPTWESAWKPADWNPASKTPKAGKAYQPAWKPAGGPSWEHPPAKPSWEPAKPVKPTWTTPVMPTWQKPVEKPTGKPTPPTWMGTPTPPTWQTPPAKPTWQNPPAKPTWQTPPAKPTWQTPPAKPTWQDPPAMPTWQMPETKPAGNWAGGAKAAKGTWGGTGLKPKTAKTQAHWGGTGWGYYNQQGAFQFIEEGSSLSFDFEMMSLMSFDPTEEGEGAAATFGRRRGL